MGSGRWAAGSRRRALGIRQRTAGRQAGLRHGSIRTCAFTGPWGTSYGVTAMRRSPLADGLRPRAAC